MTHSERSQSLNKRVVLHEGKFKRFIDESGWEFTERVKCSGVVAILAVTDSGKIILVEQHRIPVGKDVIELPAGLADGANRVLNGSDEPLEDAAQRELIEETGFQADHMERILEGPANSSSNSDIIVLFYAHGLRKVSKGGGDHTESITVHEVGLPEVDQWIQAMHQKGKLIDPKIYAGLYWLKQKKSASKSE